MVMQALDPVLLTLSVPEGHSSHEEPLTESSLLLS